MLACGAEDVVILWIQNIKIRKFLETECFSFTTKM